MKLYEKMRHEKLLSATLLLFTLSIGIVIGTLVNTGVNAARGQNAAPDATPLVIPRASETANEFTKLAKKLEPSVVNITCDFTRKGTPQARGGRGVPRGVAPVDPDSSDDDTSDLFRRFFESPGGGAPQPQKGSQSGTGFIVDKNGYIITNNHVVTGENGTTVDHIRVKLNGDSTEYRARIIGTDSDTDVAVIKIDPRQPLTPVTIGNSDAVQVGDWAVAIGSPFNLEETVTAGIVSATGRHNISDSQFQAFIQTDAAINPGNSGGPLLNIRGEVIGVNTMIATESGGSQGVGFALPVNVTVKVYNDIIRDGHVTRGSIGVTFDAKVKEETLKALGVGHGVIVTDVTKGGPSEKAGLHADDIIVGLNGQAVKDGDDMVAHVADTAVGAPLTLNVDRDGKKMDFKVIVQSRAELFPERYPKREAVPDPVRTETTSQTNPVQFGLKARPVDEEERSRTPDKRGVSVTYVEPGSFAEQIEISEHDIIISINRQPVASLDDIRKVQQTLKPGDPVAFKVVRMASSGARSRSGRPAAASPITRYLVGTLP